MFICCNAARMGCIAAPTANHALRTAILTQRRLCDCPSASLLTWASDRMMKNPPCPILSSVFWAKGWETTTAKRSKFMRSHTWVRFVPCLGLSSRRDAAIPLRDRNSSSCDCPVLESRLQNFPLCVADCFLPSAHTLLTDHKPRAYQPLTPETCICL